MVARGIGEAVYYGKRQETRCPVEIRSPHQDMGVAAMSEAPPDAPCSYLPFQFTIADLLWLAVLVALLGSVTAFPPLELSAIVLVLYVVKGWITQLPVRPMWQILLYSSLVLALLLYLYYCIWIWWNVIDLLPRESSPLVDWIGMPIWLFLVPSVSFVYDVLRRRARSLQYYCLRSAIEIVVLLPLWTILWFAIQFFCFGWFWGS